MTQFNFNIHGDNNYVNVGYNGQILQETEKQKEINAALEAVKRSYSGDNTKYSSSVEYYLRLTEQYQNTILDDLAKSYPGLDRDGWECEFVPTDKFGANKKILFDCDLFMDAFLYYSHPDFPSIHENKPHVTIQFKTITCYPNWWFYMPHLSFDLQYHGCKKRYPREAYGLRNIDYYVWFFWSKEFHNWKKIMILKEPNVLTPQIMMLEEDVPGTVGVIKKAKPGACSTKRLVHLFPENEVFQKNLILNFNNPEVPDGRLH